MVLINKLTAIADAIRAKTGKEDTLTLDQMPLEIAGIQTGVELNFKVVGGTIQPTSPSENMIWVNTDVEITSWVFSATEPGSSDVMALSIISGSPWYLSAPQSLSTGDVLNFEIPENVSHTYEAINIADLTTGDEYFVRNSDGSACNAWVKGTKVSVVLSNDTNKLNGYGGNAKTAYIHSYGSYGITEGMVWIATGTTNTVEFNALKENGIMVYPMSAKQYVSGAWMDKIVKIYQGGAWAESAIPRTYIFKSGEGALVTTKSRSGRNSSVTLTQDSIAFYCGTGDTGTVIQTQNPISLTSFSKLKARAVCTSATSTSHPAQIGFATALAGDYTVKPDISHVVITADSVEREYSLPIPSGVESVYIGIYGMFNGNVYDLWLE